MHFVQQKVYKTITFLKYFRTQDCVQKYAKNKITWSRKIFWSRAKGHEKAHFGRFRPLKGRVQGPDFKPLPLKGQVQGPDFKPWPLKGQGQGPDF